MTSNKYVNLFVGFCMFATIVFIIVYYFFNPERLDLNRFNEDPVFAFQFFLKLGIFVLLIIAIILPAIDDIFKER